MKADASIWQTVYIFLTLISEKLTWLFPEWGSVFPGLPATFARIGETEK